jgi:lysophospholipase L1-like esterase
MKTVLWILVCSFGWLIQQPKPTLYVIGDSTVQNSDGNGTNEYWGWGSLLYAYIDTNQVAIRNHAKPGTSTRAFINEGRWDKILQTLKQGDFVMIQFGHNDGSPINDTARARGTLKGIGEDSVNIINAKTAKPETVHSYGWYLRKMVKEAKEKGASVIICSLVPREKWKDNRVVKEEMYPEWAEATAKDAQCLFINLNQLISQKWEAMGAEKVRAFFPVDHTHTNLQGAQLNAACVIEGLKQLKDCGLVKFLKP